MFRRTFRLQADKEYVPKKRRLQLRSVPEILFNSAAMAAAEICAIPRNAYKPLSTSCVPQKRAQPMTRTQLILFGGLACRPISRSASDLGPGIHTAVRSPDR
jgi:hypothetical protein